MTGVLQLLKDGSDLTRKLVGRPVNYSQRQARNAAGADDFERLHCLNVHRHGPCPWPRRPHSRFPATPRNPASQLSSPARTRRWASSRSSSSTKSAIISAVFSGSCLLLLPSMLNRTPLFGVGFNC